MGMNPTSASQGGINRRTFLGQTAMGTLGLLSVAHLLRSEGRLAAAEPAAGSPAVKRAPAQSVICLFQNGGPSQMDLFDPKPFLNRMNGKPYAGKERIESIMNIQQGKLLGTPFQFKRHGRCGMELSEILPRTAQIADQITLIRSMFSDSVCHEASIRQWVGGNTNVVTRPSLGSWLCYGLGSMNANLPAYVVLPDPQGMPVWEAGNWTHSWLPAAYQATPFIAGGATPVLNLKDPEGTLPAARGNQLRYLDRLNRRQLVRYADSSELAARIANFEMAARMQSAIPPVVDLSGEPAAVKKMYGLDNPTTQAYGTRVLLARRLVEQGVRFVGVYHAGQPWDTHSDNAAATKKIAGAVDQPSAALVADLQQRGLLDSTVVLWLGEFGRTPITEGASGRDHSRRGFSMWLAGGGFKKGYVHGTTDEFGYAAVDKPVSFHQLHATLLRALGLDHRNLTFEHEGRLESLTDSEVTRAEVVHELLE